MEGESEQAEDVTTCFSVALLGMGLVVGGSHLKLSRKPHWKNPERFFLADITQQ